MSWDFFYPLIPAQYSTVLILFSICLQFKKCKISFGSIERLKLLNLCVCACVCVCVVLVLVVLGISD